MHTRTLALAILLTCHTLALAAINREALVRRHNVHTTTIDPESAVSVGNGDFAFTIDVTGLQSLPKVYHEQGIPLETLSTWAWHSFPNQQGLTLEDAMKAYPFYGRTIRFPALQSSDAGAYFRQNPHPIPLGQICLMLDDRPVTPADLTDINQELDLWTGIVRSRYRLQGEPVEVTTAAHATQSAVAVTIRSPLLEHRRLSVQWRFPLSYDTTVKNKPPMIWDQPEAHQTRAADAPGNQYRLERTTLDATYLVRIATDGADTFREVQPHVWSLRPSNTAELRFATAFAAEADGACPDAAAVLRSSTRGWADYWTEGGVVDLSRSADPRAAELERRIILSQYLMRVNYAGAFPPAETGLTQLSWYGKHNSEMYFWHAAHWYQWGHIQYLERGLDWYQRILPAGMAVAAAQGFEGVRWPKMSGIDGRPGPGTINPFIIWNQPNPIYLCELVYRANPNQQTLEKYRDLVFESARFLASYAQPDPDTGRYHLGPPIKAVTEDTNENQTRNPTFELAYWHYGLQVAQTWRRRLGLPPEPHWQQVLEHLSPLPMDEGKYLEIETFRDIYRDGKPDPNSMLMALGFLPRTSKVDPDIMRATFEAVTQSHPDHLGRWVSWAMGQAAMTCARLGEGERAVAILTNPAPNTRFMPSGHVRRPKEPNGCVTYLPVNASLLTAVGLMTAGWDDAPDYPSPGFPRDDAWIVEWEGLNRMP